MFLKDTFIDFLFTKTIPEKKSSLLNGIFKKNSLKQFTLGCVDVCILMGFDLKRGKGLRNLAFFIRWDGG